MSNINDCAIEKKHLLQAEKLRHDTIYVIIIIIIIIIILYKCQIHCTIMIM